MSNPAPSLLLFGASGAIGNYLAEYFNADGWRVIRAGRALKADGSVDVAYDPIESPNDHAALAGHAPFDAVCWAQGMNLNDSIYDVDLAKHRQMYDANCTSVIISLQMLLSNGLLAKPARMCVISSIWQDITRQNKFSYSVTKAALRGLILSASADLAQEGHLINAVLPGVLETPMTRANLAPAQISAFEKATLFNSLPQLSDVAHAVWSLLHQKNTGITGQFIKADRGYSNVRIV